MQGVLYYSLLERARLLCLLLSRELVPRRNESRSLQISGVKSGAIWTQSTENHVWYIGQQYKSSYGRPVLCLTSQTRRVWWHMCTGKIYFMAIKVRPLYQDACAHQKFHLFFFAVPRMKYAQQQKRHHVMP